MWPHLSTGCLTLHYLFSNFLTFQWCNVLLHYFRFGFWPQMGWWSFFPHRIFLLMFFLNLFFWFPLFHCSCSFSFGADVFKVSFCLFLFLSQVSFFLFIVFVVYTMLPFSMRDAIIASVVTSASHTIVLSVCLSTSADHMEPIVWQVRW